jgi:hypothetical protein
MAKWVNTAVLDAALDATATATRLFVCSAQPSNYTEASTTYMLAQVTISGTDFTKAAGDSSGRKVTVSQQADITITNGGDANHIALARAGDTTLLLVTTCTQQTLTAANTVTVPAFKQEIADPT